MRLIALSLTAFVVSVCWFGEDIARLIKHDSLEPWSSFLYFHLNAFVSPPRKFFIKPYDIPGNIIVGDRSPYARQLVESRTDPPFLILIPDPKLDVVVSWFIAKAGVWDPLLTSRVTTLLQERAQHQRNTSALDDFSDFGNLVVDVGANVGWFSLLATAHGYDTVAYEAQERLAALLQASAAINGWSGIGSNRRLEVIHAAITDLTMFGSPSGVRTAGACASTVANRNADTCASSQIDLASKDNCAPILGLTGTLDRWGGARVTNGTGLTARQSAPGIALDDAFVVSASNERDAAGIGDDGQISAMRHVEYRDSTGMCGNKYPGSITSTPRNFSRVLLLKVDVEGHEIAVINGGRRLLASGLVENAVFEFDPHTPQDLARWEDALLRFSSTWGFQVEDVRCEEFRADAAARKLKQKTGVPKFTPLTQEEACRPLLVNSSVADVRLFLGLVMGRIGNDKTTDFWFTYQPLTRENYPVR